MAKQKDSIDFSQVQKLLGGTRATESELRDIFKRAGITTQAAADQWAKQYASAGQPGFFEAGAQALYNINPKGSHDIANLFRDINKMGNKPAPPPKKKKDKAGGDTSESALQQLANMLTQGYMQQGEVAAGQLGQQLAQQNAAVTGTVDQFLTGTSSGNPAVDAAQAAYAKAYSAGEGINSANYQNMGLANQAYLAASPYQPVLSLLTQLGSGQYKELPAGLVQNLPQSIQYALQQAGITEIQPGQSGGTTIPNPAGGWPKNITQGSTTPGQASLSQILGGLHLNSIPGANPNVNPGGTTGNPNTPGA